MIENNNTQNITLWISRTKRITKRSLQQRIRAQVAERATRRQAVVFRENTADVHHVHVYTPDSVPLSIASVLHTTVATMTRQDSVLKVSEQDCRVVSPVSHKPNMVNSHAVNSVSPVSRDTVPVPIIMAVATSPVSRDMDSKATVPAIRRVKRVATSLVSSRVAMATIAVVAISPVRAKANTVSSHAVAMATTATAAVAISPVSREAVPATVLMARVAMAMPLMVPRNRMASVPIPLTTIPMQSIA